jgi:uncharacterized membrane protein YuzA (DUF378 family)
MELAQGIGIILAFVGALNWGLVGLFNFDLVAFIGGGLNFGETNIFTRFIYVAVMIAGIIALTSLF